MPPLPPTVSWTIAIGLLLAFVAVVAWRRIAGSRVPGFFALTEYWVYTTSDQLPKQEAIMDRMVSSNPHNRPGRPCIGAREGLLFTDIRLHIALAKKARNPLVFRPDLFDQSAVPDRGMLESLSAAESLIKVRYMSNAKLRDTRHLQFMPHLADAMSDLAEGLVVYDVVCEQLYTAEDFKALLEKNNNAERPDIHVKVEWVTEDQGEVGRAVTKGLRKVGMAELKTDPVEPDQQILVTGLLHRAAHALVRDPDAQGPLEFEEFGDIFVLDRIPVRGQDTRVTIVRRRGE